MTLYVLGRALAGLEDRWGAPHVAQQGRYRYPQELPDLPGFDLRLQGGMVTLQNGRTGAERRVNPYEMMYSILHDERAAEAMDELELQELCGFFGLTVQAFRGLFLEHSPLDAFELRVFEIGKDDDRVSDSALDMMISRKDAVKVLRRG